MEEKENFQKAQVGDKGNLNADFCRCPLCPCCFFTVTDLEKHMKTFGISKEEHYENYRRTHARLEHGSANGPE